MKTELIKINASDYGLEETKAKEMVSGLKTTIEERKILENAYIDVIDLEINEENLPTFKELRLKIVKNRTQGIEKWHKTNKAFYLAGGRFVDAIKNKEILVNEQMEAKLMEAEKYFENLEVERLKELQSKRVSEISKYMEDVEGRNFSDMDDDVWTAYLQTKKKEYDDRIAAENKAEEERIAKEKAEALERERIKKENEQLKKEAEEKERLAKLEEEKRAKAEKERLAKEEAERKEREEKARKEREAYDAKLKKEREKRERMELEEKAKREKLEAELKAKHEAERKAKEAEEERIQSELNKGDADKVKDLIADLKSLKTKYSFKSAKNEKMYSDVGLLIDKVINHIK